jgi:hypothetical protein
MATPSAPPRNSSNDDPDLRELLAVSQAELARETARRQQVEADNERLRTELAACKLELREATSTAGGESSRARLPKAGDAVIAHWAKWQFFKATIDSFDVASMLFTVNFADGDQTNRVQPVSLVAMGETRPFSRPSSSA